MKRLILAIFCAIAVGALGVAFLAQAQQGKLASLIQAGNRKAALEMIKAGANVNEAQPDGTRPIHWAVYRVDYEILEALIAKKATANVTNELGSTPLSEAVKLSDARMVKTLLDAGSGPEGSNEDGQTALMLAIKNGDLDIVQLLVTAGANVNVVEKVQDQTPLMWAASATRNAGEMVKVLLDKGAKVNIRAKYTDWPSHITSEPRAQYHTYGGLTPLLYAARNGCYACVEAIVGAGADVNVPSPEGITPLMIALDYSHNDVAKFLMDHKANPNVWDVYGRTALYIAVDKKAGAGGGGGRGGGAPGGGRGAPGAGVPIPVLPAAVGQAPVAGQAPAAQAAAAGRGQGAPGAGAGAGRGGAGGRGAGGPGGAGGFGGRGGGAAGPASSGPAVSSMQIITALLAAGVDTNSQLSARRPESGSGGRFADPLLSTGTTPLFRATMNNDMEVINALVDKGASPNVYDMGLTPFLLAAGVDNAGGGGRGGPAAPAAANTALLDLFLAHGADINSQVNGRLSYNMRLSRSAGWPNIEGYSALHAAVQGGRTDMVRYLLDHGARTDLQDWSGRTVIDIANGVPSKPAPANFGTANIPAAVGTIVDDTVLAATGSNSANAGRGRGGGPASPEIRTMLQNAAPKK